MNPQPANRTSVIVAVLVGIGALLSSLAGYLFLLGGVPNVPRVWILPDPIGWGFGRGGSPLPALGMLLALVVLSGLTWLFVRLIVRGALPGHGAAVFFGTWGAVIIASAVAGVVRAPLTLAFLQIDPAQIEIYQVQFFTISTAGVTWALVWGWIAALVAAILHRSAPTSAEQNGAYTTGHPAPAYPLKQAYPQQTYPQQTYPQQTYPPQYTNPPQNPGEPQPHPPTAG